VENSRKPFGLSLLFVTCKGRIHISSKKVPTQARGF
jgi:hypothetical protein